MARPINQIGGTKDMEELKTLNAVVETFQPAMLEAERQKLYKGWKAAVAATQFFVKESSK